MEGPILFWRDPIGTRFFPEGPNCEFLMFETRRSSRRSSRRRWRPQSDRHTPRRSPQQPILHKAVCETKIVSQTGFQLGHHLGPRFSPSCRKLGFTVLL